MAKDHNIVHPTLFQESDFFNPADRGQVKYEMLRARCYEGQFITRVCKEFGYSRESFYQALEAFRSKGLAGLAAKTRGKKKPDKVTPEIIGYVIYQRAKLNLSGAAIAKMVFQHFHVQLHKRTVERILAQYEPFNP